VAHRAYRKLCEKTSAPSDKACKWLRYEVCLSEGGFRQVPTIPTKERISNMPDYKSVITIVDILYPDGKRMYLIRINSIVSGGQVKFIEAGDNYVSLLDLNNLCLIRYSGLPYIACYEREKVKI
jgi:hypothetical protein